MKKIAFLFFILPTFLHAQNPTSTIEGTVNEVLRLVTHEKREPIDTASLKKLFLPDARLGVLNHHEEAAQAFETISIDDFAEMLQESYYEAGFWEYQIGLTINEYNGIANAFQAYEGIDGEGEKEKGINSYQLVYFEGRWWIENCFWTGNGNGVEIPKKYLDK